MSETKEVVAREVAEQEFDRFIGEMDLEVDPAQMDDEEKRDLALAKQRILSAMLDGRLVVDEKGQPVFTPKDGPGTAITFFEPTGASLMAADQKKRNHSMGKMLAILSDMTKQPAARFAKMKQRDLRVCLSVQVLFLA